MSYSNDILTEREEVYGDPVVMHEKIARLWSAILEVDIEATDVALMMIAMKVARAKRSPGHEDSMIDVRGYSEIHDLIAQRQNVEKAMIENLRAKD